MTTMTTLPPYGANSTVIGLAVSLSLVVIIILLAGLFLMVCRNFTRKES